MIFINCFLYFFLFENCNCRHPDHATERRLQLIHLQAQFKSLEMKYSVILENDYTFINDGPPEKIRKIIDDSYHPSPSRYGSDDKLSFSMKSSSVVDIQSNSDNSTKSDVALNDCDRNGTYSNNYKYLQFILYTIFSLMLVCKHLRQRTEPQLVYHNRVNEADNITRDTFRKLQNILNYK